MKQLKDCDDVNLLCAFESLKKALQNKIVELIEIKGKPSQYFDEFVLEVPDDYQYNFGHGYLIEISEYHLIDNNGLLYNYDTFSFEKLCSIIEYIKLN